MEFNFRESFQAYSNVELLKIIDQADKYQPEAVEAARLLLGAREVSDEDFQDLNEHKVKEETAQQQKNGYRDKALDLLQPVIQPAAVVETRKWLNILLVILALQYIWMVARYLGPLREYLKCKDCAIFTVQILSMILPLYYIPVIFLLLYKRKRWGWILLFADNIVSLVIRIANIGFYFVYSDIIPGRGLNISDIVFLLLIRIGFILFLWRPPIAGFFNVNDRAKKQTAIIAAGLAVAFCIIISIIA